jgi:hypothetical protein
MHYWMEQLEVRRKLIPDDLANEDTCMLDVIVQHLTSLRFN